MLGNPMKFAGFKILKAEEAYLRYKYNPSLLHIEIWCDLHSQEGWAGCVHPGKMEQCEIHKNLIQPSIEK
jgi:hypothetical protein